MISISFSWDDGSLEDFKMMDLSTRYGIPGMFFIPATNAERKVLSRQEIKELDRNEYEIGAHTYSHKYLSKLSIADAEKEMIEGKDFLEQLLGKKTQHFCFPGGRYNKSLADISRQYFSSARTADTGALIEDSFLIKPAFHFYDRGKVSLLYNSAKNRSLIFPALLKNLSEYQYFELLRRIISELNNSINESRMIIWGHSWEIEQYSLWNQLELFFQWLKTNYSSTLRSYSGIIRNNQNSYI